jgi:heme ABC exporter ATP-binding subunit CcmA
VSSPVVAARGVVQVFGRRPALGPIDVRLEGGERLAVLGDNGAGKTTLLRVLATATRPAAGHLELFGLDAWTRRERVRPRLGYLGHQPGLYSALTARENLRFFATLYGLEDGRVAEALAQTGLEAVAGRRVDQLSRGQQQRLGLARTVLHHPDLLILDEPDASLDAPGRRLLGEVMEGRTVVLATHDRPLARDLCGRGLLLRGGRDAGDPWKLHLLENTR